MSLKLLKPFLLAAEAGVRHPVFRILMASAILTRPALTFDGSGTPLTVDLSLATDVEYSIDISGSILTPSADGPLRFPLTSTGSFRFRNQPFPSDLDGPFSLRAIRTFEAALTNTRVGEDHISKVALPMAYQTIHVFGDAQGLVQVSPKYPLPRKQLDLLQMPFDVLAVATVLPPTSVEQGDKWNTDSWLVPMLTGIEAVVDQTATCELVSLTESTAGISLAGSISGAVQGSASEVTFSGDLVFDRSTRMIRSVTITQTEKRVPGPVSPGLEVTAKIQWSQQPTDSPTSDARMENAARPEQLQLILQTPLKLQLRHSREWYLFHETPSVLMLRQLRDGHLISQCNISNAVTVPPGQHTPDREFRSDVEKVVQERRGRVLKEQTLRDDGQWRIRQVQALGDADGEEIVWDYFLCSAATGEQYSLVFSHSRKDEGLFADSAAEILKTLRIARPRPALPFR